MTRVGAEVTALRAFDILEIVAEYVRMYQAEQIIKLQGSTRDQVPIKWTGAVLSTLMLKLRCHVLVLPILTCNSISLANTNILETQIAQCDAGESESLSVQFWLTQNEDPESSTAFFEHEEFSN